jgi:hypothetical protein
MWGAVKFGSYALVYPPSAAPKLMDTTPGPMALMSCAAATKYANEEEGVSSSTMRA